MHGAAALAHQIELLARFGAHPRLGVARGLEQIGGVLVVGVDLDQLAKPRDRIVPVAGPRRR